MTLDEALSLRGCEPLIVIEELYSRLPIGVTVFAERRLRGESPPLDVDHTILTTSTEGLHWFNLGDLKLVALHDPLELETWLSS